MAKIPDKFLDLFEKKALAHVATLMPDGSPQITPVWVDYDGEHIRINSATGRQKDLNMRRNPKVAVSIVDPDDNYHTLQVRGTVVAITEEGANEHIDKLAKKYTGRERYGFHRPGERRVVYKIKPDFVHTGR